MYKKILAVAGMVFLSLTGLAHVSSGAEFPSKTIEILLPMTPGSSIDIMSRLIADIAPTFMPQKQPMVVVNKPGAGGSLAAAEVISSKPDGHKLMASANIFFGTTVHSQKVPFDPNHLVPLAGLMEFKNTLIVKGDAPWKTFNELVDFAKKNPGKVKWGHTGRGINQHLFGLLIFRKAGAETVDIPFPGPPQIVSAVLGGHVDVGFVSYGTCQEHIKAAKLKCLITMSDRRYGDPPNVPCAVELGYPEVVNLQAFVGLYAHKDTPGEVKRILMDALKKTYDAAGFKKKIEDLGEESVFKTAEFMSQAKENTEKVAVPLLKEFGLYAK
jgi:tripartite-type tricarboxylate transporter receptor subunit TctC